MAPNRLINACLEAGCPSIAFTYTEPLTYYEYVYDSSPSCPSNRASRLSWYQQAISIKIHVVIWHLIWMPPTST
jgi:hypothetical protein